MSGVLISLDTPFPFGKYKGQPLRNVVIDQGYLSWVKSQPNLVEKYASIIEFLDSPQNGPIVISKTITSSKTPEHNKLQAMFLDERFVEKVLAVYFGPKYFHNLHVWNNLFGSGEKITATIKYYLATGQIFTEDEFKKYASSHQSGDFFDPSTFVINCIEIYPNLAIALWDCLGGSKCGLDFESSLSYNNYWRSTVSFVDQTEADIVIEASSVNSDITFFAHYSPEGSLKAEDCEIGLSKFAIDNPLLVKHLQKLGIRIIPNATVNKIEINALEFTVPGVIQGTKHFLHIELKPILGDDYPEVLREMSRRQHNLLIVDRFESNAIDRAKLVDIFGRSKIRVIFLDQILNQLIPEPAQTLLNKSENPSTNLSPSMNPSPPCTYKVEEIQGQKYYSFTGVKEQQAQQIIQFLNLGAK